MHHATVSALGDCGLRLFVFCILQLFNVGNPGSSVPGNLFMGVDYQPLVQAGIALVHAWPCAKRAAPGILQILELLHWTSSWEPYESTRVAARIPTAWHLLFYL